MALRRGAMRAALVRTISSRLMRATRIQLVQQALCHQGQIESVTRSSTALAAENGADSSFRWMRERTCSTRCVPPQAQQDEEPDANTEKVADGSDDMHKQDDVIDAHNVLLVYVSCTRAQVKHNISPGHSLVRATPAAVC